jgi:hypothetical protein
MSTLQFTCPLIVTIPGQLIASSLWNNEFINIFTNGNPLGIGAYSDTDPQMQTSTDPFPSGTSRPTSLAGELERIRYILNLIIGQTYWYNHPHTSLETLFTAPPLVASGTVMVFYQAAAPIGWMQVVTHNDQALRVVSSAGGGSGGINPLSTGLNHTHTMANHTHTGADHTHTMANHTHSTPNHQHNLNDVGAGSGNAGSTQIGTTTPIGPTKALTLDSGGSGNLRIAGGGTDVSGASTSGTPSTNTSDSTTPGAGGVPNPNTTDAIAPTFQYIDVIICSKN